MGLNFPGRGFSIDDLNTRTVYKTLTGGTATIAEKNSIVAFLNGSNAYTWTMPPSVFSAGNQGVWRKTGSGDITIAPGSGVTFRHQVAGFDNQSIKLDGTCGYSVYWEMIKEIYESNDIEVLAGDIYELPTGHPMPNGYVVGQKILISGFTEAANNGVKTVSAFFGDQITVAETLTIEAAGDDAAIVPQDTFELSGSIKVA